jgi:hypothetical protein
MGFFLTAPSRKEEGNWCNAEKRFNIEEIMPNDREILKFAFDSSDHRGHENQDGYPQYPAIECALTTASLWYRNRHNNEALYA